MGEFKNEVQIDYCLDLFVGSTLVNVDHSQLLGQFTGVVAHTL